MVTSMPISGQQAPSVPLQAGTMPATTTAQQLDIGSIIQPLIMIMVVVMMMKMMGKATEGVR